MDQPFDEARGATGHDFVPVDNSRDEHPSVIAGDMARRRRPRGHIIALANEKGGVGKSTLAFHIALALSHRGFSVLAVDCDRRQQTMQTLLDARDGTARTLRIDLPRPAHLALQQQSGAQLLQEIERAGSHADYVIVDLAGNDSPLARRVITLADTVVTPVNCSQADLAVLGRISPVGRSYAGHGLFGQTVAELRAERVAMGMAPMDWIVTTNRVRRTEHRLIAAIERDLHSLSGKLGFRLIDGLTERLAYRELLPFGLCYLDLKLLPGFGLARTAHLRELRLLIDGLDLPDGQRAAPVQRRPAPCAPVSSAAQARFREALAATRAPVVAT